MAATKNHSTPKSTSSERPVPDREEPLTYADLRDYQKFGDLEAQVLKPAGWIKYHEVVLSTFEDRPGSVWRVMRLYFNKDDKTKGGLIAVKSQVSRGGTPFITLYQETKELQ